MKSARCSARIVLTALYVGTVFCCSLATPAHGATLTMSDLENLPDYLVEAGVTPLLLAVAEGLNDEARQLVAQGADVNVKNEEGWSPLFLSGRMGNAELFELLCRQDIDVGDQDPIGNTPLHYASAFGRGALIEYLLKKNADINARREDGQTPLHFAAMYGHKDAAELLIQFRADVHAASSGGTPLHLAAYQGHTAVVSLLLNNGAEVDARDPEGNTPLHDAMSQGHQETVGVLLAAGADVDALNKAGQTPTVPADKMPVDFDYTDRDAVTALAKQAETAFYRAVEKGDMSSFHQAVSKKWQDHMTIDEFNEAYRLLLMLDAKRQYWKGHDFILEWPPALGEDGMLRVRVRYPAPDEHAFIEQVYLPEGGAFKLGGYHLSFRPYNEEWERHNRATVRFYEAGEIEKALEEGNRALRTALSLDPVQPNLTLISIGNLAGLHTALSQFEEVLPLRYLALTIAERAYGRTDLRVAEQLDQLMAAFLMTGQKEEMELCNAWGTDVRAAAAGDAEAAKRIEKEMDIQRLRKNIPGLEPVALPESPELAELRKDAEAGNTRAQQNLASAYRMGKHGLKKDPVLAAQWTLRAAEGGSASAQHSIASSYQGGRGVPKDVDKAITWHEKAAAQNYSPSMFSLGLMYESGRDVPKDVEKSLYWYRLAEENGSETATERIRRLMGTDAQ